MIGPPALAAQHQVEQRTAASTVFFRQFVQSLSQLAVAVFNRLVLQPTSRERDQPTGATLG